MNNLLSRNAPALAYRSRGGGGHILLKRPMCSNRNNTQHIQQIEKKPDNPQRALVIAKKRWIGNEYKRGDIEDPYYYRCFKNADPIDQSFEEIAKHIYLPLLAHSMQENLMLRI